MVNAELNAADSFIAAWLPGPQGEGIADLLFRGADGKIRFDFRGRLPMAWPRSAAPPARAGGGGSAPLFPLGYGLRLADPGELPQLPEE
jgi:beta-glucosidase